MEHLESKWEAVYAWGVKEWQIVSVGELEWGICFADVYLPGDETGERTAKYICDLHNERIKK